MSDSILTLVKPCIRCGATDRYVCGQCRACANARSAAYHATNKDKMRAAMAARYAANPDRQKASAAAWYAANPDKAKASRAAWYAANSDKVKARAVEYYASNTGKVKAVVKAYQIANKDKVKAQKAAYRAANLDKVRARVAAWGKANPDKVRARGAAWHKANPEAGRIHYQNYQAKKRDNGGTLSKDLSAKLFKLQKGKCPCCKQPLGDDYHLDHIDAISTGGANIDSNMQLLRKICNLQKHAKHPVDFMQSRGFLL